MLQTSFDIRFSGRDACVIVESSRAGDVAKEAELVAFAYYATETIARLGPAEADPVVRALTGLHGGSDEHLEAVRVVAADREFRAKRGLRIVVRYLDARGGPRVFLQVKVRGERTSDLEARSIPALLVALLRRHATDMDYRHRLALTSALIGRIAAVGRIASGNELDVALASADVASQSFPESAAGPNEDLRCTECGYTAPADRFGPRLWPSERASIRRCPNCGSGLWSHVRRRVRRIPHEVWTPSEELREELLRLCRPHDVESDETPWFGELKTLFEENNWPYSEVLGLPVLVTDLSGPLGTWKFYAQVVGSQSVVLLFSVCPLRVPSDRRAEASLFLTHANHGLVAGNFELDFDDGEIRYKTVLQIHEDGIDPTTLRNAVRSNGLAMETYLPGIGAVITGASARVALARRTNDH